MEAQGALETTQGLVDLKPTKDSKTAFQAEGKFDEVKKIDSRVAEARKRLFNFEDESLTKIDMLSYSNAAAIAGDLDLDELVQVRMYYAIPYLQPNLDILEPIRTKLFRNAAVAFRDKSISEKNKGLVNASNVDRGYAERCYEAYLSRKKGIVSSKINFNEEDLREKLYKRGENAKISGLFFPPEVAEACAELWKTSVDIVDGETDVQGVDKRWLQVYVNVVPRKEIFPKAYEAMEKLIQYMSEKYGVTAEQIDRYTSMYNSEFKEN